MGGVFSRGWSWLRDVPPKPAPLRKKPKDKAEKAQWIQEHMVHKTQQEKRTEAIATRVWCIVLVVVFCSIIGLANLFTIALMIGIPARILKPKPFAFPRVAFNQAVEELFRQVLEGDRTPTKLSKVLASVSTRLSGEAFSAVLFRAIDHSLQSLAVAAMIGSQRIELVDFGVCIVATSFMSFKNLNGSEVPVMMMCGAFGTWFFVDIAWFAWFHESRVHFKNEASPPAQTAQQTAQAPSPQADSHLATTRQTQQTPSTSPSGTPVLIFEAGLGNREVEHFSTEAEALTRAAELSCVWILFRIDNDGPAHEVKSGGIGLPFTYRALRKLAADGALGRPM
jgi:hypothetical protein